MENKASNPFNFYVDLRKSPLFSATIKLGD